MVRRQRLTSIQTVTTVLTLCFLQSHPLAVAVVAAPETAPESLVVLVVVQRVVMFPVLLAQLTKVVMAVLVTPLRLTEQVVAAAVPVVTAVPEHQTTVVTAEQG